MNWQLMVAVGIFLGFIANLVVSHIPDHLSWRFQIASASIPTICLLTLIWAAPESPRFLLKKEQVGEAYKSLLSLRETPLQAARELYYANAQIQVRSLFVAQEKLRYRVTLCSFGKEIIRCTVQCNSKGDSGSMAKGLSLRGR